MSWSFSPALVAAFSEACCSDIEPSAQSNTTPMPDQFYWPDKPTEHSRLSRCGMTSEPLTVDLGEAWLMWFRVASRVKTSAQRDEEMGWMASGAAYGPKWQGWFAKFSQESSSWKTAQCSLLGGLDEFSETWPRWGSMRNGASYLRRIPALPICESASGYWQTPVADDAVCRARGKLNSRGEPKLSAQVKLMPTVCSRDYRSGKGKKQADRGRTAGPSLSEYCDGLLNPEWTEWLMGWPIGHTALKPLETARFREFVQQHGEFLQIKDAA